MKAVIQVENKHTSRLIKAFQGFNEDLEPFSTAPQGMFGRVAIIKSGNVTLNSENLDIEFVIPFDDDTEANEAEIIVYNLSKTTLQGLKYNASISVEAGYKNDTGVIFNGFISDIKTKWESVDKITTLKALDDMNLKERDIVEKTYKKGTKASYILKDLIGMIKLPLAVFRVKRDHTYKDEVKVSGQLMQNIRKYAEVCGISVYINKSKIYARHISEGDNTNFIINASTGLIGIPEEFTETITAEDYEDTINGYKAECVLQHRLTTASIVKLESRNANGTYRVCSGEHRFNEDEAITKIKMY